MNAFKFIQKLLSNKSKSVAIQGTDKSFETKYNELGVFKYDDEGFTIEDEALINKIRWRDITELNVYKADLLTIDRIEMEIVYGEKAFTISEDLPGWYQFLLKTKSVFPSIPKDWDLKIIQPAFATNWRNIYTKE